MFTLSALLNHDNFVIQCHNYPDADTIAAGFALYLYLKENGKNARLIYSGNAKITKANLLEMINLLSIPIEYAREMPPIDTLVLVDCQYGERNVEKLDSANTYVIDHHVEVSRNYTGVINNHLGSCSTVIWDLLNKEGFDFKKYPDISTALYYGSYTDTSGFEEIAHPLDKDMRDGLKFSQHIVKRLRNNNLSLSELEIAGEAFSRNTVNKALGYAIFQAAPCDPNILGFISDLALQTEGVDVCTVYNENNDGYKLSMRSCIREVMANDYARFLTEGVGNGGGHKQKAGGFISKAAIAQKELSISEYMERRTEEYFGSYDVIMASDHDLKISEMKKFKKKKRPVYYAKTADIFKKETPLTIRTLEGDAEVESSDDIYLMIGIEGEVYPIKSEKFYRSYRVLDVAHDYNFEYPPSVINRISTESVKIMGFAKPCISTGDVYIYAAPLTRNTKVFTIWNEDEYMAGRPGDYVAVRADDHHDVYIIRGDIFSGTYGEV
ncbi:MAG: DHH family phosphoesterase [Oscillospiraceae bacterium]|nr:DHH family phosphoesterase [Oscillospiraceae bacterium]